ncbi:MAG TPA: tRNA (guanosine(37)-N1)-methyltransferase TrmD [Burkholderiales bacterium]|jgi:tRNA (guanine37-N1)-methyltransferase|nr:tRNA (guanosine(37)-N1)-methyltransferase TrmD [Burkholderiales bacterium]
MIHLDVVTLFPEMFEAITGSGITQRARDRGFYQLVLWNPRDFSTNAYRSVDDRPYGGGPGMVMMAQPLSKAMASARQRQLSCGARRTRTIYLSPQGRPLTQKIVEELGQLEGLVLLAGRYEGVDERLLQAEVQDQISIGDYVLSGGELPAMVLMDALIRRIPGVLNDAESAQQDSFEEGLLDFPHYTRPELYQGEPVPAVLLSGHHVEIARWRMKQALGRTWERRPDLLAKLKLSADQAVLLEEYKAERNETQELIK